MAALISISCVSSHLKTLSLSSSNSPHFPKFHLKPLSSSASISQSLFSQVDVSGGSGYVGLQGGLSLGTSQRSRRNTIVCVATTARPADSAEKRHRQSETRRLRNKARKSEIRTRMRKVFDALKKLRKKTDAVPEEIIPIENLIAEAYSAIDKAVVKGTIHRNTAAHRKSRLARNKRAIEIKQGWYTPAAPATTTTV